MTTVLVTGGANGFSDIPAPAPFFADPKMFYLLALAATIFSIDS